MTELPEHPKEIKAGQWYWVLACVDSVDDTNKCVHLTSCKASHWYHFDNVFKTPRTKKVSICKNTIMRAELETERKEREK